MEEGDPRPSISLARTPSKGAAVDLDLLEQLLSGDNAWLEVATNTSRSPNFSASPSNILSDATTTTTTPANTGWIQSSGASSLVRERFNQALAYISETQSDADVLVQLWVPVKSDDGQLVLTTSGQPFTLDQSSDSLIKFREVSTKYQFSADVASESSPGLPGRVFIGRLPEWSPDVLYFTSYEYPRVSHAQYLDVHGTMGLPVFEKGNYSCLGVIELILTRQKLNFTSELNTICSALQAVNLRSTEFSSIPHIKFNSASYKDGLPEILEVLQAACITHKLPLAQIWVTCAQQGKRGSRHSDDNYRYCISTIDAACYVNEPQMQSFHEACSEHHLLRGQGVAGKAFTTNQPCFLPDIGSSTKLEYPLSHHAKIFNLKGAVAIRLRCTRTGTVDFVLEFFLPADCEILEEQKAVLDSLSGTLRSVCKTLRVITDKEMEDEAMLEMNELNSFSPHGKNKVELSFGDNATEHREEASWTSLAGTSQKESDLVELHVHGMLSPGGQGSSLTGAQTTAEGRKVKRRTKTEKTVSLQVLRQHFAGSLKDAAKSLGVCPTTLKRICRQHGITRWPSRKIKKVDHSLRKLQQIIDSVHGGETDFQLNTLYKDLTNTSISDNNLSGSVTVPPTNQSNLTDFEKHQHHRLSSNVPSTSHSHSSCSHSSDSNPSCSGATKHPPQVGLDLTKSGCPVKHSPVQNLQTENASINEHFSVLEAPRDLLQDVTEKAISGQHSSRSPSSPKQNTDVGMRVKATFGSEKVRFRLKPECNFQELKQEIAKRMSIEDTSSLIVKYLDDDSEWVLMTCDADLQECLHVYKLADIQTTKISVHLASSPATRANIGHTCLS